MRDQGGGRVHAPFGLMLRLVRRVECDNSYVLYLRLSIATGSPSSGSTLYCFELARVSDDQLRDVATRASGLLQFMAAVAVAASRILGQEMYDVQLRGALALARGSIAEMQTGEGKTLDSVPAVAWLSRDRKGVHVMT